LEELVIASIAASKSRISLLPASAFFWDTWASLEASCALFAVSPD
jgi:hypothetical protein